MKYKAKEVLAQNLAQLMALRADLNSQMKIEKRANKVVGGGKVRQRTISNLKRLDVSHSPTLRKLEAVAGVFGLETWQLLHPTMGKNLVYGQSVSDVEVGKHIKPAPKEKEKA